MRSMSKSPSLSDRSRFWIWRQRTNTRRKVEVDNVDEETPFKDRDVRNLEPSMEAKHVVVDQVDEIDMHTKQTP